jgi:hypothetical protein
MRWSLLPSAKLAAPAIADLQYMPISMFLKGCHGLLGGAVSATAATAAVLP